MSFAASLISFALVGLLVFDVSRDRRAAFLAAGLLAATFDLSDAWFDLARVDSLFLALSLAALFVLRRGRSMASGVLAAGLAAAAFFTKQTALLLFAPFAIYAVVGRDRSRLGFLATFAGLVAIGCWALDRSSDGWFGFYVLDLPRQHATRWWMLERFWRIDLLAELPIAIAVAATFLLRRRQAGEGRDRLFFVCLTAGTLGSAWVSRMHSGGGLNGLIPAHVGIAILFGLGIATLTRALAAGSPARAILFGLCLLQFAWIGYDPRSRLPTEADRQAGEALLGTIDSFDGEVLVLHHGYLPGRVGKPTSAQLMAIRDVLRGTDTPIRAKLVRELDQAVRTRRFDAVVVDGTWIPKGLAAALDSAYSPRGEIFDDDVFWPVSGMRTRPQAIWVARESRNRGPGNDEEPSRSDSRQAPAP